jgi:alpha-beta hydrolase superfamily lysophospholipase
LYLDNTHAPKKASYFHWQLIPLDQPLKGGGIILSYLTQGNRYEGAAKLTGSIASAPLVQVTNPPPAPVFFALRYVASVIVPNLHYGVGLDPSGISRDPVEVEDYKADPLVKDTATLATRKC